jgi:large subunit ribosomal protein L22
MNIIVKAKFIKTAPRKLRLVADGVKYKKALEAADLLRFINKSAAKPILKALNSALAIIKEKSLEEDKFYLSRINCDQGPRLKRRVFRSRGRATAISKGMSHLTVTLSDDWFDKDFKSESKVAKIRDKKEDKKIKIENSKNKS